MPGWDRITERQRMIGVSNLFQNAKVFRFHETILSFGEPGWLGDNFLCGVIFCLFIKTYMGLGEWVWAHPLFPHKKWIPLPWSHLSFSRQQNAESDGFGRRPVGIPT